MGSFLLRRLLSSVPTIFGIMGITFLLFFAIQSPQSRAKRALGEKAAAQDVENWVHQRGYDKPLLVNREPGKPFYDSQFFHQFKSLACFDLGRSDINGEPIIEKFKRGVIPSLCITLPAFVVGLWSAVSVALFLVLVRESALDTVASLFCVMLMNVPAMLYVILGHWLGAGVLKYFPAYGFSREGFDMVRFLALPVIVMALSGLGSDIRIYRAIFLEVAGQDYVRTARAKGLSIGSILIKHVLRNGAIALVTLVVSGLPFLMLGSLLIEDFFGIPGLGGLSIDAIRTADFSGLQAVVFIGSLLYLTGITLADMCYGLADPRIRLK